MQRGKIPAGDRLLPVDTGRTKLGSLRLEKLHRSQHIFGWFSERLGRKLNQKTGSEGRH
jgi:hypothetical protein